MRELTERQIEIFVYIHGKLVSEDLAPTVQEIQQEFGFGSPNAVQTHLAALEKKVSSAAWSARREAYV